jgi:excinuclease UvrABC nuclease subunit
MLLKKFKSVKKIKELPRQELESAVGKSKAGIVFEHFHS